MKIRIKIFLGFLILLLLSIIFFFLLQRIYSNAFESQISNGVENKAYFLINAIDILLYQYTLDLKSVSSEIGDINLSNSSEIDTFLKKKIENYDYESMSYFDINRIRIADTKDIGIGKQHPLEGFWFDVLDGNLSLGHDVRIGPERKFPVIFFATPIKRNGEIVGVLVIRQIPEEINNILSTTKTSDYYITLVKEDKKILFSNEPLYEENYLNSTLRGTFSSENINGSGVVREYRGEYHGFVIIGYCFESGYKDFKGNNWLLLVSLEESKILEPVRRIKAAVFIYFVLFFIFLSILGWYLSKILTKPLVNLKNFSEEVAKGNFNVRLDIKSGDEIEELSSKFNEMVVELKEARCEIKKYNSQLRVDLSKTSKKVIKNSNQAERFNRLAIGRELKMIELKKKIAELEEKLKINGKTEENGKTKQDTS
ncbi:MAG: HAMP domain-containing protein [archaeon]